MVQVLPYVPGIIEQITPYLNQATSQLSSALYERGINKKDANILQQLSDENLSNIKRIALASQLSERGATKYAALFRSGSEGARFDFQKKKHADVRFENLMKEYSARIKQLDADYKQARSKTDRMSIADKKKALQTEQAKNRGRIRKGEEPIFEFLELEGSPESAEVNVAPKKQKFDIKNPGHKALRDKILEQTGGNQEEAKKMLLEAFE